MEQGENHELYAKQEMQKRALRSLKIERNPIRFTYDLEAVNSYLSSINLNSNQIVNAWELCFSLPALEETPATIKAVRRKAMYEKSLEIIGKLDYTNSGSPQRLNQQFGIKNFGRYPFEILADQDAHRDDQSAPYGITVFAGLDKGSFTPNSGVYHAIENIYKNIKEVGKVKHLLRICEIDDEIDLTAVLEKLNKRYNPSGNRDTGIAFGVFAMHGNEDVVGGVTRHTLPTEVRQQHSRFFKPEAPIALVACSTGGEGRIAQSISDLFDTPVIAPDSNIRTPRISIENGNNRIGLNVSYQNGQTEVKAMLHRPKRPVTVFNRTSGYITSPV